MAVTENNLIKVGRTGILVRGTRIPASFFRHQQPGKRFVVLAEGDRPLLMHVRPEDLEAVRRAYHEYHGGKVTQKPAKKANVRSTVKNGGAGSAKRR